MMLSTSILLIMSWADAIIIGVFKTEVEVGIYNVRQSDLDNSSVLSPVISTEMICVMSQICGAPGI